MNRHNAPSSGLGLEPNAPASPASPARPTTRLSPSPQRHHHHHGLTALSPLQTFSPLQPKESPRLAPAKPNSDMSSETGSLRTRSRASSITRSLSRRQSLIASAERWGRGMTPNEPEGGWETWWDGGDGGDGKGVFSRLTLVKAPHEGGGLKRRSKSSSSLAPFSAFASAQNVPATTARGPRRSFAASSFAGFTPMSAPTQILPASPDAHRISSLYQSADEDARVGVQRKVLSPEEVVDVARSLSSPVLLPEGGFKGAELKRRKSAGATSRRSLQLQEEEKPGAALEPVEYVQLDDDTLLPFVERPEEVKELLAHPSNEKMFESVKAAFPKFPARPGWAKLDPEEWGWDEFVLHLTQPSRIEVPDYVWVYKARAAVRARSVALWEKVGVCLGCDGDLLNAGGEDGLPPSWGGLGLGDEGEYDPTMNQVVIQGLEAVDPEEERKRHEQMFEEEFGEVVREEIELDDLVSEMPGDAGGGALGMGMGMGDTPARRAVGGGALKDPILSPTSPQKSLNRLGGRKPSHSRSISTGSVLSASGGGSSGKSRTKSFVGLTIMTSPQQQNTPSLSRSPIVTTPNPTMSPVMSMGMGMDMAMDRGPGNPLFPSSFGGLSVEPNLGRSMSVAWGGAGRSGGFGPGMAVGGPPSAGRRGMMRKYSGAGLSESAITFASESEFSAGHEVHA